MPSSVLPPDLALTYCVLILATVMAGCLMFGLFLFARTLVRHAANSSSDRNKSSQEQPRFVHHGLEPAAILTRLEEVRANYLAERESPTLTVAEHRHLTARARQRLAQVSYFQAQRARVAPEDEESLHLN